MKTLIYQYYYTKPGTENSIDPGFQYYEMSKNSISAYASMIGSDYIFMNHEIPTTPFYGIFEPFRKGNEEKPYWCENYDYICFVDSDILATRNAKNVFEVASDSKITINRSESVLSHEQHRLPENILKYNSTFAGDPRYTPKDQNPLDPGRHNTYHANSGVVIFPKKVFKHFNKYISYNLDTYEPVKMGGFDQYLVNMYLMDNGYHNMHMFYNFNLGRFPRTEDPYAPYLLHYHRSKKKMMRLEYNSDRILK